MQRSITIERSVTEPVAFIRDLTKVYDTEQSMWEHVSCLAQTYFYHMCCLHSVHWQPSHEVTAKLVSALVLSHLNYKNDVLARFSAWHWHLGMVCTWQHGWCLTSRHMNMWFRLSENCISYLLQQGLNTHYVFWFTSPQQHISQTYCYPLSTFQHVRLTFISFKYKPSVALSIRLSRW